MIGLLANGVEELDRSLILRLSCNPILSVNCLHDELIRVITNPSDQAAPKKLADTMNSYLWSEHLAYSATAALLVTHMYQYCAINVFFSFWIK